MSLLCFLFCFFLNLCPNIFSSVEIQLLKKKKNHIFTFYANVRQNEFAAFCRVCNALRVGAAQRIAASFLMFLLLLLLVVAVLRQLRGQKMLTALQIAFDAQTQNRLGSGMGIGAGGEADRRRRRLWASRVCPFAFGSKKKTKPKKKRGETKKNSTKRH